MASQSTKISLLLISILMIIFAYLYQYKREDELSIRLDKVLNSLLAIENSVSPNSNAKIAIGYGSCLDYIIRSEQLILGPYSPPEDPNHFDIISSREELHQVFAYFFQHGAAAERYISNLTLFKELIQMAHDAEVTKKSIGGNAPIMTTRFFKEGINGDNILLGAQISPSLREFLPLNVKISGPNVDFDDIHLLLEYSAGETWQNKSTAPRANRFIVHNDDHNPTISSLESFHLALASFDANLLIVSGLQMMDHFYATNSQRKERLVKLGQLLSDIRSQDLKIHFEMASYTDEQLLKDITVHVLPYVDSLGMNEQELPNLFHILAHGNVSLVSDSYPRVATVLDEMRDVYNLMLNLSNGRLTRIHVHTLAFQAILTKQHSSWKHSIQSAAKSALTAHRHTCGSESIDIGKAKLIMDDSFTTSRINLNKRRRIPFNVDEPVAFWTERLNNDQVVEFSVAPVLVCTKVLQTGGGGDNVSAAGLVLQI